MKYTIRAHPTFRKELKHVAKKHTSIPEDFAQFLESLQVNPTEGEILGKDWTVIKLECRFQQKTKEKAVEQESSHASK